MGDPQPTATVVMEDASLNRVYDLLMAPNFPPGELISADELIAGVKSGIATVRIVGSLADPVAVAVTESLEGSSAVLLAYFATRDDRRGRGVGSALLGELLSSIRADDPLTIVLGEVEHPGYHAAHPMHGDPASRLRFYLRLGGFILDVPYFQPPIDEDQDPVYGMLLLALAPSPRFVKEGHLLPEAGLATALSAIMAAADPKRHPVAAVLDAASVDARGVRLLTLEQLAEAPVLLGP